MPELEERFRSLSRTPAPDLWREASTREPGPLRRAPAGGRRFAAAAVAFAVAVFGIGFAIRAFTGEKDVPQPGTTVSNGLLAFASGGDVWVVNPDGSGLVNVTDTRRPADAPDGCAYEVPREWSPDGSRLALYGSCDPPTSDGGANYDVFVMDADGSGRENLTTSPEDVRSGASQLNPHWSPDGTQIAFDGDDGLYVVNADGSGLHKVADGGLSSWSPDGTRLAFVGDGGIYTANADGSDPTLLTGEPGFEDLPAWSPAGDLIAFVAPPEDGGHQLEVVRPDGGGRRRLTDLPNDGMGGYSPSWSPDGARIAVEVHRPGGSWDLYVVNADGSGVAQLTASPGDETRPTWSPDGTKIAFMGSPTSESTNSGTFDVYTVDPDGTNLTRITDGPGAAPGALTWQPVLAEETMPSPSPTTPPSDGSISAIDGFVPEGRLLVQVDDQVELLEQGAERSRLIGQDLLALDLSPDGSRALVSTPLDSEGQHAIVSLDLTSGERTQIGNLASWVSPGRWSPDGSRVAVRVGDGNVLCLRDLAFDEPRCLSDLGRVYAFDWSPDGTRIVYEQGLPGSLTILDVGTGETSILARWDDPAVLAAVAAAGVGQPVAIQFQGPEWSPSGRYVAVLGMVGTDDGHANVVLVFDLNGNVVARSVPFGEFSSARGWSPAADVFAYAAGEPPYQVEEVRSLDVSTGEDRLLVSTADVARQTIRSMAWSPSGRWVAIVALTAARDGSSSEIHLVDTAGTQAPRILELSAFPELIDWGP